MVLHSSSRDISLCREMGNVVVYAGNDQVLGFHMAIGFCNMGILLVSLPANETSTYGTIHTRVLLT